MKELMSRYTTKNLKEIDPNEFESVIKNMVQRTDWKQEGYDSPKGQRMPSIVFHWGHNHDFGTFQISGRMEDRHIEILDWAIENGMPTNLAGKKVLDIGCWTGGMSLLLYAMGEPHITVIEEVFKYAETVRYLKYAFGLKNMSVIPKSLYDVELAKGSYDLVNLSGVLYHITDIVVALKMITNWLKIGGIFIMETSVMPHKKSVLFYAGPSTNKDFSWNWFFPSMPFLEQIYEDLGLEIISTRTKARVIIVAKKREDKPMMLCGMSRKV